MRKRLLRLCLLGLCLSGPVASAGQMPAPEGPVVLTVTGAIANTNGKGRAAFDRAMLESLGLAELATSTPWTDGTPVFRGVPMARLLDAVGATGATVHAVALNSYAIDVEVEELRRYPVLLAMEQDGKPLRIRDRGPLWIVYPRDQHAELRGAAHDFKWIWQLKSLEVR
jgi:hypothetical protein